MSHDMNDPFSSAKTWIVQAREDLSDFQARERAVFSKEKGYTVFEDVDRQPGIKVVGLKLAKPPETLSTKAANIVGALRSALDQATWRASVLLGASESEKIYFPFAGTKTNFEDMFREKGRCKNIPAELHTLLKALEGYPTSKDYSGGNNLLYALSAISNPNKHTETYRVGIEVANAGELKTFRGDIHEMHFPPKYDAARNEIVFFTTSPTGKYSINATLPAFIAFGEVPIVGGQPVVPILYKMARMAERIIRVLKREAVRTLRKKTI
jgi:hypothetical protein